MMSFGPPGANPTITRTGREGQDCASAGALWSATVAASSRRPIRIQPMSACLVGNDGIAPDHGGPGRLFLFQVRSELLRRVEHRDQGMVLDTPEQFAAPLKKEKAAWAAVIR